MDNKLSELSKPVAWADERGNLCTNTLKERGLDSKHRQDYEKYSTPIYSQEYVSALLARIEELQSELSEWTECKHTGYTWHDRSGRERCGKCGADIV